MWSQIGVDNVALAQQAEMNGNVDKNDFVGFDSLYDFEWTRAETSPLQLGLEPEVEVYPKLSHQYYHCNNRFFLNWGRGVHAIQQVTR